MSRLSHVVICTAVSAYLPVSPILWLDSVLIVLWHVNCPSMSLCIRFKTRIPLKPSRMALQRGANLSGIPPLPVVQNAV